MSRWDNIIEAIKGIDIDAIKNWEDGELKSEVVEDQKVYFWIRLFLKEESSNIEIGDKVILKYTNGEELETIFAYYDKQGLNKNFLDEIINFNPEDNKKVLCLMVNEKDVNFGINIPFIRTLFKQGRHYEYQLVKRGELLFINERTGENLEYFDCDF